MTGRAAQASVGDRHSRGFRNRRRAASPASHAVRDGSAEKDAAAPHQTSADSTVVVALIGRLKDEDAEVRAAAAQSLGKLEDARAVPALVAAIADREGKVRAAAAEALGKFSDPRAVTGLSSLLGDSEVDVRKQALEALSEYESGVPVAGIIRLLNDPDAEIRHSAVHALGRFGDRSAGAALAPLAARPVVRRARRPRSKRSPTFTTPRTRRRSFPH